MRLGLRETGEILESDFGTRSFRGLTGDFERAFPVIFIEFSLGSLEHFGSDFFDNCLGFSMSKTLGIDFICHCYCFE